MDFCSFCCNSGLNRCQLPCARLAGKSPGLPQCLQFRVRSLSVVWWASLLDFSNFCNSVSNRCQLPSASEVGKSLGFLCFLQFKVEAALRQFGGQVFWIPVSFAIQGRIVVSCPMALWLPYAGLVGKSPGFLHFFAIQG